MAPARGKAFPFRLLDGDPKTSNQRIIDFQLADVYGSNRPGRGDGMFERFVERRAKEALSDTPVVLVVGPRRAGKTTLVRKWEKLDEHISRLTTRPS